MVRPKRDAGRTRARGEPSNPPDLAALIAILRAQGPAPEGPPSTDPFELVLWENVAYLASPARRLEAFRSLRERIGLTPAAIRDAGDEALLAVAARGILKQETARKLRECAAIAIEEFGGDLARGLPKDTQAAKRALRRFPGIGEPGAEKILLFTGRGSALAPESNGLRVLMRLGLVADRGSYARNYAAARDAAAALPANPSARREAHLRLRKLGRTVCKNSAPDCPRCPLDAVCGHVIGG